MTSRHPVQRGQRYRRLVTGVFAVGIASFFVGIVFDQQFAGLVAYSIAGLVGIAAMLYLQFVSSVTLLDERDQWLHERASHAVVNVFAYVGLPAFIALFLLDATGRYAIGPTLTGVLYAFSAFYLAWGVAYSVYRYRT